MKRFLPLVAALCLGVFAAGQAQAGFYIEPYVGYETGETDDGTGADDTSGTAFGARLGYSILGLAFGAEYNMSGLTIESAGTDTDVDATDLGVFVSYEFPIMFRVFATLMVDSTGEITGADLKGNGMRIGVGYTGLPFVVINLEKVTRTYDEIEAGGVSASLTNEIEGDNMMVSISVPLP